MPHPTSTILKYNLFILLIFSILSCSKEKIDLTDKDKNNEEGRLHPNNGLMQISFVPGTIEKIFSAEKPWESKMLNFYNIQKNGAKWHMWYNSFGQNEVDFAGSFCLAASTNGKVWERVMNSGNSNILIQGIQKKGIAGTYVFYDGASLNEPYKMICLKLVRGQSRTYLYSSADGINWNNNRELYNLLQDSQFSVISLNDKYYIFSRHNQYASGFQRAIGLSVLDKNFQPLKAPRLLLKADANDSFKHIYNNAASKVNDSCVLLFPTYYNEASNEIQLKMIYTRNLKDYFLVSNNIYSDLFPQQNIQWAIVSPGLIPTNEEPDTYWLYYYGTSNRHDDFFLLANMDVHYYRIKLRVH